MEHLLFKTPYNYDPEFDTFPEINVDPSETVPDQSLTIRELFERYQRGLPLDISDHSDYGEDEDFNDEHIRMIDRADAAMLAQEQAEYSNNIKNQIAYEKYINAGKGISEEQQKEEVPTDPIE